MKDVWLRVSRHTPRGHVVFALAFDDGVLREAAPYYWGIKLRSPSRDGKEIARCLRAAGFTVKVLP